MASGDCIHCTINHVTDPDNEAPSWHQLELHPHAIAHYHLLTIDPVKLRSLKTATPKFIEKKSQPPPNKTPHQLPTTMPTKRHAASTTSAATPSTPTPLSSGPTTLKTNASPAEIALHVWHQYTATTSQRTLLLDAFMVFLVLVGGLQFLYCVLAGNYVRPVPFYHPTPGSFSNAEEIDTPWKTLNWIGFEPESSTIY